MEWIGLSDVIKAVHAAHGGMTPARQTVCRRAGRGLLRARAAILFRDGKEVDGDAIPKEFWSGGQSSINGDWGAGDLQARAPLDSRGYKFVRWEAFGIQFSREDAE